MILGCIDVSLLQLQRSALTSCSLKVRNWPVLISGRGFLQGSVVLLHLRFISKNSITWNHKGGEVTALVQAELEVPLLLSTPLGKKDCFLIPMNVGWSIKIRNARVQYAISLVFPDIPNLLITTYLCFVLMMDA